jgi:hypothetical protein
MSRLRSGSPARRGANRFDEIPRNGRLVPRGIASANVSWVRGARLLRFPKPLLQLLHQFLQALVGDGVEGYALIFPDFGTNRPTGAGLTMSVSERRPEVARTSSKGRD